jgi:hypothetical protein
MQQIATALVKAQRDFAPALKQSTNPHFRSRYADLAACVEAVIDALNANGIALIQRTHDSDNGVAVETLFVHESGETITGGILHVPAAKQDPQGYGSALTYARRYSLMAACGIAPEDDDANAASKTRHSAIPRVGGAVGATYPVGKDGSITASFNPPAGEVTIVPSDERIAEVINTLHACKTLVNLQVEWGGLTKEEQKLTIDVKDAVKAALLQTQNTKG